MQAFPTLFLRGTKGYLHSCVEYGNKRGFAQYCRDRIRSVDPRFREDLTYVITMTLIKVQVEIRRSIQTHMRQARRTPNLNKKMLMETNPEDLQRTNKTYQVFKNVRGTSMYYEDMKKKAMSTLRQLGSPTIFFTLSYAEFQNEKLFKQVLETCLNRTLTDDEIKEMNLTQSERNKLIADNVVITTIHFQKRLEKVFNFLMNFPISRKNAKKKYTVANYFYRLEYQLRGVSYALTLEANFKKMYCSECTVLR